MAHLRSSRAIRWLAPVALVGAAGLVACGGDSSDSDVSARTAAPADVAGSDVHLENQAAEIAEQQAHTQGSAATMSGATQPDDTSDGGFVPGTRRMPVR
jgi:hypothetical protein